MTAKTNNEENSKIKFKAEIQQLLDIVVHSLYTDREIFLRELISNASDAINRIQFEMLTNRDILDEKVELAIYLETDEENGKLIIRDTGVGMTREEMVENLGTIAHSGAKSFLQAITEAGQQDQNVTSDIIGQFGVGFYSVFMVAEEVTVTSRSYKADTEAAVWSSTGKGTYSISPAEKADRGTTIEIKLKDDTKEFAAPYRIRQIIKTHSDFVSFPIYLKEEIPPAEDEKEEEESKTEFTQINQQTAIWRQSKRDLSDEKYNAFYQQLTFDFGNPLLRLHTSADAPVQFYTLLFIPSKKDYRLFGAKDDYGLKLYARKVLIQENYKELLPSYLRFVEGVVDSEDLPLNISREAIQTTFTIGKIKNLLVRRLSNELKTLAEEKPDDYKTFWQEFGVFIKEGVATDQESKDKFIDLLRFQSSTEKQATDLVSLSQYAGRMKEGQKEIYYILGDDYNSTSRSPHLEYFKKHELEVLYLTDTMDSFMLAGLTEYDEKPLKNVDDAGLELPDVEADEAEKKAEDDIPNDKFDAIIARFKDVLGDKVEDVLESKILTDSPCRLVNPSDAINTSMQRVQRLLGKEFQIPKKILEINRSSKLIQNISTRFDADNNDPLINPLIEQLFENALVIEGIHPNPADMISRVQQLMEAAAQLS